MDVASWHNRVVKELGDEPFDSLERTTPSGVALEPLYSAEDVEGFRPTPGEANGPTLNCPVVDGGDPGDVGRRVGEALAGGAESVWLRLDRSARLGTPLETAADTPSEPDSGAPIHHGSDLETALPAKMIGSLAEIWLDVGANALPWAAIWLAHCERAGIEPQSVAMHFGLDPLAALARDGSLPRDLMKLSSEMAALVRFAAGQLPGSSALAVSTAVYHEAGASSVQELGFLVATLLEYVRMVADSGLDASDVGASTSVELAVGSRVFTEIAKLRAARLLVRAALGARGVETPFPVRLHAVGSRRSLTCRARDLNVLRGAEQAFVAFGGGADAISVWGFDRASGPSGRLAHRLALNTATILAYEGQVGRVTDPAAGSYFVERKTADLAAAAWALAQDIERGGGMRQALLSGWISESVRAAAVERQNAFESGRAAITGVTDYVDPAARAASSAQVPSAEAIGEPEEPGAGATGLRLDRHRAEWRATELQVPGYSRDFVVEELLGEARRGATLFEIALRLGDNQGAPEMDPLEPIRDAAPFEAALASGEVEAGESLAGDESGEEE